MPSIYPNAVDGYAQLPLVVDNVTNINAELLNALRDAIVKIEVELGILPSGFEFDTVAERLNFLDSNNTKTRVTDLETSVDVLETTVVTLANLTWANSGHTGTASYLAGFDGTGIAVSVDPSTVGTTNHTLLTNIIWASSGHTGTASYLAGFNGAGVAVNVDPSTVGTTDHTLLTNTIWADSDHTGTASYLAGFDGTGSPTNINPTTIIGALNIPSGQSSSAPLTASGAPHTANSGERLIYNPSGGTFTINAPASPTKGQVWAVKNASEDLTVITISGNGNNIENPNASYGLASSFSLFGNGIGVTWQYDGVGWLII